MAQVVYSDSVSYELWFPWWSIFRMAAVHRETIQKQIQQDWANREYIEVITGSIKKITDFLNSFGELICTTLKVQSFPHCSKMIMQRKVMAVTLK
jgi:hypothetical protein